MSVFETIDNDPTKSGLNPDFIYAHQNPNNFENLSLKMWPEQWYPSAEFPTPQSASKDEFSRVANDALSFSKEMSRYRVGEPELPVAAYREHFLQVVANNQCTVVSSETGSGKSSQLGLYLLEAGAPRVYVTSPRIIAARELAARARQNLGPDYEHLAGYLTGNAADSDCGEDARLIYVTEQLLFKMANRGMLEPNDVVINDEAHERTAPTVILLGLIKELQKDSPSLKLIISSATINTDMFAKYLADPITSEPAPVLILPGRTHPITRSESDRSVASVVSHNINLGKNVLAFEPGAMRMKRTKAKAQSRKSEDTIHLLYGDQSPTEQKTALTPEPRNHIIATRIGETSITPQGKDLVVDSGLSNVGRYTAGVRGLETVFSSKDTITQRMGRVGRTKPGEYILAIPEDAPPPPLFEDRPDYEAPAIQNSSVAAYITELMREGRRLEDLDLLESPTYENLQHDYLVLKRLGAIAIDGGEHILTSVGEATTNLSLDVSLARMLVEARSIELDDEGLEREALMLQVAAAASVQQVNGILDHGQYSARRYRRNIPNKESFSNEHQSDVLFELDVFASLYVKQQAMESESPANAEALFERFLATNDIIPSRYNRAARTFEELCRRENLDPTSLVKPYGAQRRQIIECRIAGAEEVFVQSSRRAYHDIRGDRGRILGRRSTIAAPLAKIVMGSAFDLDGMRTSGRNIRRFIAGGSAVTLEQLRAKAPHRLTERSSGFVISKNGKFAEKKAFYFDGELHIGDVEGAPSPTLATRTALITAMMKGEGRNPVNDLDTVAYKPETPNATEAIRRWTEAQKLEHRTNVNLNTAKRYQNLINKIVRESVATIPLNVVDPAELDHVIPKIYLSSIVRPTKKKDIPEIIRRSPDGISLPMSGDEKQYNTINYRNNIAYITLERDQLSHISREDFAQLRKHHDVKLRFGAGKYLHFDTAFTHIDEVRMAKAEKKQRREDRSRELMEARNLEVGPSVEPERAPVQLVAHEARTKANNIRAQGYRQKLASRLLVRTVVVENE